MPVRINRAPPISHAELLTLIIYDPITGIFTRRVGSRNGRWKAGKILGGKQNKGYINLQVGKRSCLAHRVAIYYVSGVGPTEQVDHINGVRTDNRYSNLRLVTHSENCQNIHKIRTKSNAMGVTFDRFTNTYKAQIGAAGKNIHLGRFKTIAAAKEAYLTAKQELHNVPSEN